MRLHSLSSLFPPKLLLPLTLLTPYVVIGHYGVSVLGLLIFAYSSFVLLPSLTKFEFRLPQFLLIFFSLYTFGYLGALANGLVWNVPIGVWNLNFFYKLILATGAFCIGMRYSGELITLFRSKVFLFGVLTLGAVAVIYPFLPYSVKIQYFGIFYPPDSDYERFYTSERLPGLGINANIYAFMLFSYLLLCFRAALYKQIGFFVSLVLFGVILVMSSKSVIALSVAGCAAIFFATTIRLSMDDARRNIEVFFRKRGLVVGAVLVATTAALMVGATQTRAGQAVLESYATVERFERLFEAPDGPDEQPEGFALRWKYWKKGVERIALAPVLGIAKDPFERLEKTLVGFYNPHNEFIRMWILYGFAGLCAWTYLLSYMTYKNIKYRVGIEWVLIYLSLAAFMMFDGGLDNPRVTVYLFLLLGLNWRQIRICQERQSHLDGPASVLAPSVAGK